MSEVEKDAYTKISISKDLHIIVKKICDDLGIKMYHFEDRAILEYLENKYPEYVKNYKKA
jgi:hypothetical protein